MTEKELNKIQLGQTKAEVGSFHIALSWIVEDTRSYYVLIAIDRIAPMDEGVRLRKEFQDPQEGKDAYDALVRNERKAQRVLRVHTLQELLR